MDDAGGLLLDHVLVEVVVELVHILHQLGPGQHLVHHLDGLPEVAVPSLQLPCGVVAHLAVVAQAGCAEVHGVKRRCGIAEGSPNAHPLPRLQGCLCTAHGREGPAGDAIHDVEGRAKDVVIRTEVVHLGHRHACAFQRLLHAELAVNLVGAHEELARRLAPEHAAGVGLAGGPQEVGRVRRPCPELLAAQVLGPAAHEGQVRHVLREVPVEPGKVHAEPHLPDGRSDVAVRGVTPIARHDPRGARAAARRKAHPR
mmetsp:Transcript_54349/g.161884  ORF Transcript_54349/g.161884 Transcript_54349/m.161884 type:complete len:256 (+) Transcript_54349:520-1287(+)